MLSRTGPPRFGSASTTRSRRRLPPNWSPHRSPAAVTGARPAPKPLTCSGKTRISASSTTAAATFAVQSLPSNCVPTSGCCLTFRGPTPRCRLQHRSSWLTASRRSNGSFHAPKYRREIGCSCSAGLSVSAKPWETTRSVLPEFSSAVWRPAPPVGGHLPAVAALRRHTLARW